VPTRVSQRLPAYRCCCCRTITAPLMGKRQAIVAGKQAVAAFDIPDSDEPGKRWFHFVQGVACHSTLCLWVRGATRC
jgi:hypothetical protein